MEIEKVKKDWELTRLMQLKEEEERKAELDEDEMMFTYTKTEVAWLLLTLAASYSAIVNWPPLTNLHFRPRFLPVYTFLAYF